MQDFAALQRLSTCFNGSLLNYSDIKNKIALITGGENFKNVTDFDKQIVYIRVIDPVEPKSGVISELGILLHCHYGYFCQKFEKSFIN